MAGLVPNDAKSQVATPFAAAGMKRKALRTDGSVLAEVF
jgi:hypothetical protein